MSEIIAAFLKKTCVYHLLDLNELRLTADGDAKTKEEDSPPIQKCP